MMGKSLIEVLLFFSKQKKQPHRTRLLSKGDFMKKCLGDIDVFHLWLYHKT